MHGDCAQGVEPRRPPRYTRPMRFKHAAGFAALLAGFAAAPLRAQDPEELQVPYVPTPEKVVAEMLRLANVQRGDVVYDLGSGDGRIVIAAAKQFGAHAVGIDINPERIQEAEENAKKAGVASLVSFRKNDLFLENLAKATVVTLYLLPDVNRRLRPKLLAELKPGSRVVSHDFDLGDWKADKTVKVDEHTVYLWVVPKGAGRR